MSCLWGQPSAQALPVSRSVPQSSEGQISQPADISFSIWHPADFIRSVNWEKTARGSEPESGTGSNFFKSISLSLLNSMSSAVVPSGPETLYQNSFSLGSLSKPLMSVFYRENPKMKMTVLCTTLFLSIFSLFFNFPLQQAKFNRINFSMCSVKSSAGATAP